MMQEAFAGRFPSPFEQTDSVVAARCALARSALEPMIAALASGSGPIWVGSSSQGLPPHDGEANRASNRFHIDQSVYDSISHGSNPTLYRSFLLAVMLHEAIHLAPHNLNHPVADSVAANLRPAPPGTNRYIEDPYFKEINSTTPGQRCVKF
jgi:hypothetical protein